MANKTLCASCKWATTIDTKATGIIFWCEMGTHPSHSKARCKFYSIKRQVKQGG